MDGLEAFRLGGPAFFGLRISLLPLRSLLAMACSSIRSSRMANALIPQGIRSLSFAGFPFNRVIGTHGAPLFPLRSSTGSSTCRREA